MASNFREDDSDDEDDEANIYHDNRFKRINSFTNDQFAIIRPTTHTSLDRRLHLPKPFCVIKLKTIAVTVTILAVSINFINTAILLIITLLIRSYLNRIYFDFSRSYYDPKTGQEDRENVSSRYCGDVADFTNEKGTNSNAYIVKLFELVKTKQQEIFGAKLYQQEIYSPIGRWDSAKQFEYRNGNADTVTHHYPIRSITNAPVGERFLSTGDATDRPLVSLNSHIDIIRNFKELFNLLRYEFIVLSLTAILLIKIVRVLRIAIVIILFGLLRNSSRAASSKLIRINLATIGMDNKTAASNLDSGENFRSDQTDELNSTCNNKTNICGVGEAIKLLRQSSFPQITSRTVQVSTQLAQNTASPTIRRVSYEHRCRSRSPRKVIIATTRRSESLDDNSAVSLPISTPMLPSLLSSVLATASLSMPTTTSIPTTIQSSSSFTSVSGGGSGGSRSNRNSPKIFEHCPNDDKENESPTPGESVQSPKMKLTENALAQQNSPRNFDTTRQRFSFSPKLTYSTAATDDSPMPNYGEQIVGNASLSNTTASPLLSSAVYKHGNYFKFPEVDCFTPDKLANVSSSTITISANAAKIMTTTTTTTTAVTDEKMVTTSAGQKLSPGQKQGARRARLKSISLDSDGAKLVEDNLGVPVEELIEIANESPPDIDIQNRTVANLPDTGETEVNSASATTVLQLNRKNKNKLTIQIDNSSSSGNVLPSVKVQTPKTPTLTQTKQKAVSLDSSDAQNSAMCNYSSTSSATTILRNPCQYSVHQNQTPGSRSMQQVSSISVPTTPKRNVLIARRKPYCKTPKSRLSSGGSNSSGVGSSAVSLSIFDCKEHICESIMGNERSMRIAIDIDDNTDGCNGTEIDEAHFYLDEIVDDEVVTEEHGAQTSSAKISDLRRRAKTAAHDAIDVGNTGDHLLLGTNLQTQKYGMLSLSNNNLETLPEIMTLSDFSCPTVTESNAATIAVSRTSTSQSSQHLSSEAKPATTVTSAAKPTTSQCGRNILQRRGSNHSLTINLNGSLGNLSKCMSVSNYSLGSFSESNYNLNYCSQHYAGGICRQIPSNTSSTQSIEATSATMTATAHGSCISQTRNSMPDGSHPPDIQRQISVESVEVAQMSTKRNLLQRRGSNTSLTLNLKGSNHANLSRFSSHSSLNIAASLTSGSVKMKQPPTHGLHGHHQQHPHSLQQQSLVVVPTVKKGLLERRNSNASLTLNICNATGLSSSNCNLRASASSLQNITNTSTEYYDHSANHSQFGNAEEIGSDASEQAAAVTVTGPRQQRKFLSSENLNSMMFSSNKLNQTHVRNSTKTCFGSVSDLKPHQSSGGDIQYLNSDKFSSHPADHDLAYSTIVAGGRAGFEQPTLCSCTGVRNITTKPLSPQSTSEDFKMYLANIQLLQNATNTLTDEYLRKLHSIFKRSYEKVKQSSRTTAASFSARLAGFENPEIPQQQFHHRRHCQQLDEQTGAVQFDFNVLPSDDEKRHLLRSLHEEFWDLPTNHQEKPLVFGSQTKNRYKTILPNEHSRVILENEPNSIHEPYINANYIKGSDYARNSYIVTQGPLPNTIYDYWLMVSQNVQRHRSKPSASDRQTAQPPQNLDYAEHDSPQKIVMLTNFIENNQQKCSIYFPVECNDAIFITSTNEKFQNFRLAQFYEEYLQASLLRRQQRICHHDNFDEFEIRIGDPDAYANSPQPLPILLADIPKKNYFLIKNFGIDHRNGFAIRKLVCLYVITRDSGKSTNATQHAIEQSLNRFICYHYWFPDWPDHHSPNDVSLLLDMTLDILDAQPIRESGENRMTENQKTKTVTTANAMRSNRIEPGGESIILEAIVANRNRDGYEPIPIIHCSAGIGRTGCLAAILNGIEQIRSSIQLTLEPWNYRLNCESIQYLRTTKNYVNVDVLGIVCNLRLQRGGMVQNSEQYELIHRVLCLYQIRIDAALKIWNGSGTAASAAAAAITDSSGSAADNNRTGLSDSMTDKNTLNQNADLEGACVQATTGQADIDESSLI